MNCLNRASTAIVLGIASALLGATADAIDLRDWGRKFETSQRFVVLPQFQNQAVLDKETQLTWERSPDQTLRSWDSARNYCILNGRGGRHGWRLPSINELMSLYDADAGLPQGHPFQSVTPQSGPNLAHASFWSHTQSAANAHANWFAHFDVNTYTSLGSNLEGTVLVRAWCVRGGGPLTEY